MKITVDPVNDAPEAEPATRAWTRTRAGAEHGRSGLRCRDRRRGPDAHDRHAAHPRSLTADAPTRPTSTSTAATASPTRSPTAATPTTAGAAAATAPRPRARRRFRSRSTGQRHAHGRRDERAPGRGRLADAGPGGAGERRRDRRGDLSYEIVTQPAHGTGSGARDLHPRRRLQRRRQLHLPGHGPRRPRQLARPAGVRSGGSRRTATVSITVDAVNDAPVNLLPAGPVSAVQDTDTRDPGSRSPTSTPAPTTLQVELAVDHGTLTVEITVLGGVGAVQVAAIGTRRPGHGEPGEINTTLGRPGRGRLPRRRCLHGARHAEGDHRRPRPQRRGGPLTDTDTLAIAVVPPNARRSPRASRSPPTRTRRRRSRCRRATPTAMPLGFAIATAPSHGSLGAIGAVTCSHATPNVCTADVVYTPDADTSGPTASPSPPTTASRLRAGDGLDHVDPVNDAPRLQNIETGALVYAENDRRPRSRRRRRWVDDSPNLETGSLTVDYARRRDRGGPAGDPNQGTGLGQIGVSGGAVTFGGVTIGTFAGGTGTTPLVVTLNARPRRRRSQALIRNDHLPQRLREPLHGGAHRSLRAQRRGWRHQQRGHARGRR